jgi:hypothetical protein
MARTIGFTSEGTEVALGMDEAGRGRSVVLLPALSSISTCAEMQLLFDRLAPAFRVAPSTGQVLAIVRGRVRIGHRRSFRPSLTGS